MLTAHGSRRRPPAFFFGASFLATAPHPVVRLAAEDDHVLAFGLVVFVVAVLFLVYLWKRRRLRRERS